MHRKIVSMVLLLTLGMGGCSLSVPEAEPDGGVTKLNTGADSPKVIESTEIVDFQCEFSLVAAVLEEESELDGRVYKLQAVFDGENTNCKIKWHDRYGEGETREFMTDASFMTKLQEIVAKYDFAQHNGYSHHVSGLPDMYGATLDIKYASGESIYAYDNQDCFILFGAMKDLVELFDTTK